MIKVKNLTKNFDGKPVIDNLNIDLESGKTTIIMGASGCGKTTFAKILLGLLPSDGGTIEGIEGKRVSAVFQEDRLIKHLSAVENIGLILKKNHSLEEIIENLADVDMEGDLIRKPTSQLSGGQKRRVAIVRAIMADSDFICFDEPFKGLDLGTKEKVMEYVKKNIEGKTVLLITHDMTEKEYFQEGKSLNFCNLDMDK